MPLFYYAIVFLPLISCLSVVFFRKALKDNGSALLTSVFVTVSACLSWIGFIKLITDPHAAYSLPLFQWVSSGGLDFSWSLRIDMLTIVMFVVVNTVSALVHIYSIGYMKHDKSIPRFFAYLSLFTFMMLMLVSSNNLLQLFFGWEGVGLASYLLIGFWYKKSTANAAAIKAFVINRIGDFGFLIGIFAVYVIFGSVSFDAIFETIKNGQFAQNISFLHWQLSGNAVLNLICIFLFVGAMGKSAQFFLHTWLPDAMEAPTPVSALLHAATMVTAGVFLIARFSPIFEYAETALMLIVIIGAITAFFASSVALVQNDIKRIIAFSTCSQLGYMFVALGIGAYGAAIFHLFTHAFFKALLFQGAGSVIHATSNEQDIRRMGGLRKYIPQTYWLMVIGTLALTGFGVPGTLFGTAGFFSKDMIIESAYSANTSFAIYAFWLLVIAAIFTAFYSWRLIFLTFHGKPRATIDVMHHVSEAPQIMRIPMVVLAFGSLFAGVAFMPYFFGVHYQDFWRGALFTAEHNKILAAVHFVPLWVKWISFIAMLIGFSIAFIFYIVAPLIPSLLAMRLAPIYRFLLKRWYFDEIYQVLFVRPLFVIANFLANIVEVKIIDGFGPRAIAGKVGTITNKLARLQTGYLYHYAFAMLVGLALLITWMLIGGMN